MPAADPPPPAVEPRPVQVAAAVDPVRSGPRRELLPDIEEINSSLSASSERRGAARDAAALPPEAGGGSGFRTGFLAVATGCGLLALIYAVAPALAERVPDLAPMLSAYVEGVDSLRLSLSRMLDGLGSMLVGER
jgi:hypothetical protein